MPSPPLRHRRGRKWVIKAIRYLYCHTMYLVGSIYGSRGSVVGLEIRLQWVRIQIGEKDFFSSETCKAAVGPASFLLGWYRAVLEGEFRGVQLTSHLHLVARVRLSGAKHLLLQSLHGVEEKNFTYFTFYFIYIYFCSKQKVHQWELRSFTLLRYYVITLLRSKYWKLLMGASK
jgi:hypothetical protein